MTTIVALSDTHGKHRDIDIPKGDIFVFAGDITNKGDINDIIDFNNWLEGLDFPYKLITAGNNDRCLDPKYNINALAAQNLITNGYLILDGSTYIDGYLFYLSPASRRWASPAFSLESAEQARNNWAKIPRKTNILVTHGPAYGVLDLAPENTGDVPQGCPLLREWIEDWRPSWHIHGHIHSNNGRYKNPWTSSYNVSIASSDTNHKEFNNTPTIIQL